MTMLSPITYRTDDIEMDEYPGIHIADVEAEIGITGYAPEYEWYVDEVRVGWEHMKLWKTYRKGDFIFEIVEKWLEKHCSEHIFEKCAAEAADNAWWDGEKR